MELAVIITLSILVGLGIVWAGLRVFVQRVLKDNPRRLARLVLVLLVLQFVLGMTANLWASIPDSQPWIVFHQAGPIFFHTITALLLLNFSVMSLLLAIKARRSVALIAVGLAGVVIAFASGVAFVNAGQDDLFSFTMSLGFLLALLVFGSLSMATTGSTADA